MDSFVVRIIKILNSYNNEKDKVNVFSGIYDMYYAINECITDDNFRKKYNLFMIDELLKLVKNKKYGYIDYRRFLKIYINSLKGFYGSKIESIKNVLDKSEDEINKVMWHLPYIDSVNSLDVPFKRKASIVMLVHDYMIQLYRSLSRFNYDKNLEVYINYGIADIFLESNKNITNENILNNLRKKIYEILKTNNFNSLAYKSESLLGFANSLDSEDAKILGEVQNILVLGCDVSDIVVNLIKLGAIDKNILKNPDKITGVFMKFNSYIEESVKGIKM